MDCIRPWTRSGRVAGLRWVDMSCECGVSWENDGSHSSRKSNFPNNWLDFSSDFPIFHPHTLSSLSVCSRQTRPTMNYNQLKIDFLYIHLPDSEFLNNFSSKAALSFELNLYDWRLFRAGWWIKFKFTSWPLFYRYCYFTWVENFPQIFTSSSTRKKGCEGGTASNLRSSPRTLQDIL